MSKEDTEIGISESELNPCPFCGGEDVVSHYRTYGLFSVFCRECCVTVEFKTTSGKEGRKEWNQRLHTEEQQEEVGDE